MQFYNNVEKQVGLLPLLLKDALVLNGLIDAEDFHLIREESIDALILEISDQIVRFSKGLGSISNGLCASAQHHIGELGFTEENYKLPILYREKIHAIWRICNQSNTQRNVAPDDENEA